MTDSHREGDHLLPLGDGRFALRGSLTFEFAANVLERSKILFAEHSSIHIDLSGVQKADSAGLALLIEWLSWARASECAIAYENIPDQMVAIARISEVSDLLSARSQA